MSAGPHHPPTGPLYPLAGRAPRVAPGVFVAPTAAIIGDVELAEGSSVWFGAVLRGDVGPIRIGPRTNVQDLACMHSTGGMSECTIGADCTIGHGAILHGCTVEDGCLIGMGSIVLDNAVIGARSVVAAGAVVPPRMIVPPGSMVAGVPARIVRPATPEQQQLGVFGAEAYTMGSRVFLAESWARRVDSAGAAGTPDGGADDGGGGEGT